MAQHNLDKNYIKPAGEFGQFISSLAKFGFVGQDLANVIQQGLTNVEIAEKLEKYIYDNNRPRLYK